MVGTLLSDWFYAKFLHVYYGRRAVIPLVHQRQSQYPPPPTLFEALPTSLYPCEFVLSFQIRLLLRPLVNNLMVLQEHPDPLSPDAANTMGAVEDTGAPGTPTPALPPANGLPRVPEAHSLGGKSYPHPPPIAPAPPTLPPPIVGSFPWVRSAVEGRMSGGGQRTAEKVRRLERIGRFESRWGRGQGRRVWRLVGLRVLV